jgi:two-component system sensor kinase
MASVGGNRYGLIGVISQTPGCTVFRASDSRSGDSVAMKFFPGVESTGDSRAAEMQRRALELKVIRHPRLARFLDFDRWNDTLFSVEELCRGLPLSRHLPDAARSPTVALEIAIQVAEAVSCCHENGLLHLSVRSDNIFIAPGSDGAFPSDADGVQARLAGLGDAPLLELSADAQRDPEIASFQAPEIRGGSGVPDVRCDVYSLGALLEHLLPDDGAPPPVGPGPRPPAKAAAKLSGRDLEILPRLKAIAARAAADNPEERFATVDAFLDELLATQRSLQGGSVGKFDFQSFSPQDFKLPFVDRDLELTRLRVQFDQAALGNGSFTRIIGEAGSGKSRLMEEMRSYVLSCQGVFLWTQATEFESNRPFSPLRDALRQFVQLFQGLPGKVRTTLKKRLEKAVGNFGQELLQSIPEAAELLPPSSEAVILEPERAHQRSLKTILNLLLSLSQAGLPVLLFIDDFQWADQGTKSLVDKLGGELGGTHLMVVCAEAIPDEGHGAEKAEPPPGAAVGAKSYVRLRSLTPAGCLKLFQEGLGIQSLLVKDLATISYERCAGNPRLLSEIVKTLQQELSGQLGEISSEASLLRLQALIPEANVENVVDRRWSEISEGHRRILSAAAVIGRKFSRTLLARILGENAAVVQLAIAEGLRRQVISRWSMFGDDWHCFCHERVHEEIYASIPQELRLKLHGDIARFLESEAGADASRIYEIALHHLRGDDPDKAHHYALLAGRASKSAHANQEAIHFFSEALRLLPPGHDELQASIREDLADSCALAGRYEEAERNYQQLLDTTRDRDHQARLEGKIGDMHFRRGANESAIEHMENALAWLGFPSPRTRLGTWLSIARGGVRQLLHSVIPLRFLEVDDAAFRGRAKSAVRIFNNLAYAYYFLDQASTLDTHLRQLNLCEHLGPSPELAHTYSSHGIVCSMVPLFRRALRYQNRGLEMRKNLDDTWGIGQSYGFLGVLHYYLTDFNQAIEYLRQSIGILESAGDQWEIEAAYSHLGFCYLQVGKVEAAEKVSRTLLKLSTEINDLKFIAVAKTSLAECDLIRGNLERAIQTIDEALSLEVDNFTTAMAQRVKGQILLRMNRRDDATRVIEDSIAIIRRFNLRNEYLVANHVALAHAHLSDVERILAMGHAARRRFLRRTWKCLKKGLRLARRFQNHLGYALRVEGVYHRLSGATRLADRAFERSEKLLVQQGKIYELGKTVLEAASWKLREGGVKDADEFQKAIDIFRKVGARLDIEMARKYLGLQDATEGLKQNLRNEQRQLSSLFKMSRTISAILDLDRLVIQISDLAIEFTGGERGYLFLRGPDGNPQIRCARGTDHNEISFHINEEAGAIIHRVWQSGIAQVASITGFSYRGEMEGELGRSVICVPLRIGENTIGLIYVENRLSRDLYTEDDLEFLTAFASQAAISLQNALYYQRAEELNSRLELKVHERTREFLKSKQELENANRLKSEFLANMSHELRTPLNAIIAMSEILSERTFGDLNSKQEIYIRHILESGVHLLSLINDVLDLSKVEAGQLELESEFFDLNGLLKGSLVVVKERAQKHDIQLEYVPEARVEVVRGDSRRIKQVVFNLLSNAVKFTPDGGRVTLRSRDSEGGVLVVVEDTGIGIAKEHHEIIFEEFRQVESSYSRRFEGTGLGLALCKKFIELHGGRIWLESEEGKGSKFYFWLPMSTDAVQAAQRIPGGSSPGGHDV